MPDDFTRATNAGGPHTWAEAFAALPLESPEDGWARLSATLAPAKAQSGEGRETAGRMSRGPIWLALAATLAAVIVVPVALRPDAAPPADILTNRDQSAGPASRTPATSMATAPVALPATPVADHPAGRPTEEVEQSHSTRRRMAAARAQPPLGMAATVALPSAAFAQPTPPAVTADFDDEAAIAALQAESARLEAVVMQMGDERVGSGPALVLLEDMISRVTAIDSMLATTPADVGSHLPLWQQRVLAMRELATMTTTQRWLAVRGEGYAGGIAHVN